MSTNPSALLVPPPATNAVTGVGTNADIRDIKGLVSIPGGWTWLAWTLLLLVVAAAGLLAARHWLRRRAKPRAPEIIIPPHVRARDRLREALALIHQPEPFCTRVSHTLRVYLEERFHLRAPERTTEEFLDELQHSPVLALAQKQSLGDFLVRCDLVKFARDEPAEPALRDLWDSAVRLVDETALPDSNPTEPGPGEPPAERPPSGPAQPEARSSGDKSQGADSKSQVPNPKPQAPDIEHRTGNSEIRNPQSAIRNPHSALG